MMKFHSCDDGAHTVYGVSGMLSRDLYRMYARPGFTRLPMSTTVTFLFYVSHLTSAITCTRISLTAIMCTAGGFASFTSFKQANCLSCLSVSLCSSSYVRSNEINNNINAYLGELRHKQKCCWANVIRALPGRRGRRAIESRP